MTLPFPLPARAPKEPLDVTKLRSFPGCEYYSDDEAEAIIQTLDALARMFLQAAARHGTHYDHQGQTSKTQNNQDNTALKRAA